MTNDDLIALLEAAYGHGSTLAWGLCKKAADALREAQESAQRSHDRWIEVNAELQAECRNMRAERDALLRDAERYRWLRERLSHQRCGPNVGWGTDELLPGDDPDDAIDAALARGE